MTMSAATARRRARELVLLGLYERQIAGNADDAIARGPVRREPRAFAARPIDTEYGDELWRGVSAETRRCVADDRAALDRAGGALAGRARAPRHRHLGAEHRPDIPYRVVIDEAVELAKAYGGTDGHKFVNGVLDKLAPVLRAAEMGARRVSGRAAGGGGRAQSARE